jgi:hypothetical protein
MPWGDSLVVQCDTPQSHDWSPRVPTDRTHTHTHTAPTNSCTLLHVTPVTRHSVSPATAAAAAAAHRHLIRDAIATRAPRVSGRGRGCRTARRLPRGQVAHRHGGRHHRGRSTTAGRRRSVLPRNPGGATFVQRYVRTSRSRPPSLRRVHRDAPRSGVYVCVRACVRACVCMSTLLTSSSASHTVRAV